MHVVLYDSLVCNCTFLSLPFCYYPNITMIVYKYSVLFVFKNLTCTRQHILIAIFIFISVDCHDRRKPVSMTIASFWSPCWNYVDTAVDINRTFCLLAYFIYLKAREGSRS